MLTPPAPCMMKPSIFGARKFFSSKMDAEQVKQLKKNFRKRIHESLGALTPEDIEKQSSIITKEALRSPEYQNARSLSIFLSMPGREVSTLDIVRQAFKDGKNVYVPYIHASKQDPKSKIMDMLHLRDEDDLNSLEPDPWGIPSLSKASVQSRKNALGGLGCLEDDNDKDRGRGDLDLVFMPAVAFDSSLNRLGHGRGFYDRYLTQYRHLSCPGHSTPKPPHLIGLALQEQLLSSGETLPTTEFDWKVDRVITSTDL